MLVYLHRLKKRNKKESVGLSAEMDQLIDAIVLRMQERNMVPSQPEVQVQNDMAQPIDLNMPEPTTRVTPPDTITVHQASMASAPPLSDL